MMGRTFWFVVGTGTGLYTSFRARRLAYRLSPGGVADQVAVLGVGLRAFSDEVRVGMAERETQPVATRPRALAASGPVRFPDS